MNLLDLPVEIGILIFSYLDTKSKISAYGILELREFYAPCFLRKLDISRSSVASVKTLTLDIFQDFAANIQELNLSGIADLTVDTLRNHIQRCSNLKTLDITFTSIYLADLADICTEHLKNISINFFEPPKENESHLNSLHGWKKSLDIFRRQQFEDVHFVVFRFYDLDSPLIFMKDVPRTKILKITLANNYRNLREIDEEDISSDVEGPLEMDEEDESSSEMDEYDILSDVEGPLKMDEVEIPSDVEGSMEIDEEDVPFDDDGLIDINFTKLFYVIRDCDFPFKSSKSLGRMFNLNFEQMGIEYIFIMYKETIHIYVSPVFSRIFVLNWTELQIRICTYLPTDFVLEGNIIFKAWNKSITDFNDIFFETLMKELTDYFPTYICMHKSLEMKITEAPSNWYCIDSCKDFEKVLDNLPEKVSLTGFCRREGTVPRCNWTLVSDSKTLRNITFLSLMDIHLTEDFFATLFVQCKNLHTLDVNIYNCFPSRDSYLPLFNSIHMTKSLKNIKLITGYIEFEMIFASLCQCPTLENIHMCDYERALANTEIGVRNIVLLIEKCHDLYSLFIEANRPSNSLTVLFASLRAAAQNLQRDHLCIEVCDYYGGWNPFADVFNPSPLHIIN